MVNYKIQANAIKNALEESTSILLIGHKKPDADTLGALCAWLHILKPKGKEVEAFCLDPVPDNLQHLPGSHHIKNDASVFDKHFDVILLNDTGSLDYAGVDTHMAARDNSKTIIINIDHHATNPHYGDINLVLADASSTTEIICRLLMHWGEDIEKPVAEALLAGIITDTDRFTNPATSYQSLATASTLVNAGADLYTIFLKTFQRKSIADLRLWGTTLSRLQHNEKYNSIVTYITDKDVEECGATENSIEGIVNYLTLIPNVNMILMLRFNSDGTVKGSFRTVKDTVDVSKLALMFGGGGHRKAAGFTITGGLEEKDGNWTIV